MNSSLKLTSQTPLGKEELKKINNILTNLFDNNDSYEFRQPVDWKGTSNRILYRARTIRLSLNHQKPNRPRHHKKEAHHE